jgi:prolyl oligopeptidase
MNEVDRYINWPGQALAYKIGQLKILELRAKAESQLGEDFDIKDFHHEVLKRGALPLDILEEYINQWIEQELN